MSMICQDAQLEPKENPKQEEINRLFDSRENMQDTLRIVRSVMDEYDLDEDVEAALNVVVGNLKYELSQLGG